MSHYRDFNATTTTISSTADPVRGPSIFPLNLRLYHHWNAVCVNTCSLAANMVLIALLLTERNRVLRIYNAVLMQNCVVDIIYTVATALGEPQLEFMEGRILVTLNTWLAAGASSTVRHVLVSVWTGLSAFSVVIIPVVFYFRYVLIVKSRPLSRARLLAIVAVLACFSVVQGSLFFSSVHFDDEATPAVCRHFLRAPIWQRGYVPESVSHCVMTRASNSFMLLMLAFAFLLNFAAYGTMIYCTRAVMQRMKVERDSVREISQRSTRMQNQMNMVLRVQMTLPLFTATLPVVLLVVCPLFHVEMPGLGVATSMAFAWMPLMSPTTTILMVATFRRRLVHIIPFCVLNGIETEGTITKAITTSTTKDDDEPSYSLRVA